MYFLFDHPSGSKPERSLIGQKLVSMTTLAGEDTQPANIHVAC